MSLFVGDVRAGLLSFIRAGVRAQTCVTSPPYWGLRDYGVAGQLGLEATPAEYLENMVEVFRLVREVLADDGTIWVNMGDCYAGARGYQVPDSKHRDVGNARGMRSERPSFRREVTPRSDVLVSGLKPKDLVGMPWRLALALQADGWWLRSDIIWCLSGGAAVYARTQKGDMPIMVKDLVRLRPETVKLWNGQKWTQVLGWSRSTDTEGALEIELRSGERIGCTIGHQWPTKRGLLRTVDLRVGDVIETTALPEPEAPSEARALDEDVAWLCGLYLAEGSMSGDKVQLAGHAKETEARLLRIERVAASFHGSTAVYSDGNQATIVVHGPVIAAVIRAYIHGKSAQDKGLKVRTWQRSNAWLRSLLDGYLAGDGHYDAGNNRWRLGFCRNDRLADDFRTLAARLDLPLRLAATVATGFGREWPCYRGDIRLTRTVHHNARVGGEIVFIRQSRARQFWDIGVEDEPHTFALASGVLTHNSKPNPMPESCTDRPTKSHEYLFLLAKSERYYYDADAIKEQASEDTHTRRAQHKTPDGWDTTKGGGGHGAFHKEGREAGHTGYEHKDRRPKAWDNEMGSNRTLVDGYARKYQGNATPKAVNGRKGSCPDFKGHGANRGADAKQAWRVKNNESFDEAMHVMPGMRNKRSVWTIPTQPYPEAHFATFPEALVEPCIAAGSRPGDTVLDPFMGSGTVAEVAQRLGRKWIGCEISPAYAELVLKRTAQHGMLLA